MALMGQHQVLTLLVSQQSSALYHLKKTKMFAGDPAPFVMELPAYHMPTVGNVLRSMGAWLVIYQKAGTIITLSTIVVCFLLNFGWTDAGFGMLNFDGLEGAAMEAAQAQCILAKIGNLMHGSSRTSWMGKLEDGSCCNHRTCSKRNVVGTFGQLFGFAEVAEDLTGNLGNTCKQHVTGCSIFHPCIQSSVCTLSPNNGS